MASDLGEKEVRAFGLAAGFVDYKVCAVDPTWSGCCLRAGASVSRAELQRLVHGSLAIAFQVQGT